MRSGLDRRSFFKVVGVGAAAGAACTTRVPEKIIPHVIPPEDQIPGQALWYASLCTECPAGCGTLVRNREGRALKIEGNPDHPVSKGGLCVRGHSALQANYHPDRYRQPQVAGSPADWDQALAAAAQALGKGGVAVLTGRLGHGALDDLFETFATAVGGRRYMWEPFCHMPAMQAAGLVYGQGVHPVPNYAAAGYILSLGADFLETLDNPVAAQRGWAEARKVDEGRFAKLVAIGPRLGLTEANADEWIALEADRLVYVALGILRVLVDEGAGEHTGLAGTELEAVRAWLAPWSVERVAEASGLSADTLRRLAKELVEYGPGLVVTGGGGVLDRNATALHVVVGLINRAIGAPGRTLRLVAHEPMPPRPQLAELLEAIDRGEVKTLVLYGTDPVFTAPAAWRVADRLGKLEAVIVLDALPSETSGALAKRAIVLPDHGALEGWGDHRAPGVWTLRQPAMNPLWRTQAAGDTLLALLAKLGKPSPAANFLAYLQQGWRELASRIGAGDFERFWREALLRGGYWEDAPQAPTPRLGELASVSVAAPQGRGLRLVAYPHIYRYDGRYANRPWLQELPDPVIQSAWSNWAELHPATARKLGIGQGDRIRISAGGNAIEVYAYVTNGVAKDVVAVPTGQGHTEAIGRFGADIPGNPFLLLGDERDAVTGTWVPGSPEVQVTRVAPAEREAITGIDVNLVTVDGAKWDHGRGIAQVVTLEHLRRGVRHEGEHHGTKVLDENGFYPPHEHPEHRWGMVVDLNACTGCGGCVVACNAENNIPVVGKREVAKGREMQWIRIERYYSGPQADAGATFVPMMCQQCSNAPCEPVCPAVATVHTHDGLNAMVYNRCIGTRYCANNCSYKVRRFNWWGYDDPQHPNYAWPEPMHLMLNPDVSVRSKGVMEKCSFCVQRIREVTEAARMEGRPVRDGEIQPACAQSCPSEAILFGDLKDPESRVAKIAAEHPRGYKILEVLNTQPAVTYLQRVRWSAEA